MIGLRGFSHRARGVWPTASLWGLACLMLALLVLPATWRAGAPLAWSPQIAVDPGEC
jgi:hypothetical protein